MSDYQTVIGLEIHIQLNTESKVFSHEANSFGGEANKHISAVTLALPGSLPMLNAKAFRHAIKLGSALACQISRNTSFDRKNYVYPDLPKSYQITQDHLPICIGGKYSYRTGGIVKTINIDHIHIEEDAGKSIHDQDQDYSLIDLNRSGTPLLELVTKPDFRSADEVSDFIASIQKLLRFLDISDANMEEGSLRADCNVSVKRFDDTNLGIRTEIKNINSKKFARQAIQYESERHISLLEKGLKPMQETRLFNPQDGTTSSMRKKEDALDYRYFPEPDLPIFSVSEEEIRDISTEIEFLPENLMREMIEEEHVPEKMAMSLTRDIRQCRLYSRLKNDLNDAKRAADFIVNNSDHLVYSSDGKVETNFYEHLRDMLSLIDQQLLSASVAYSEILPFLVELKEESVKAFASRKNILIESDAMSYENVIKDIIERFPDKVKAYRNGRKGLIGFFMGQFMRSSQKAVNPKDIQLIFEKYLTIDED